MTTPIQPTDVLPDPGTDAGWAALENEAHARGYQDARAYLDAYEHGRINTGIAGFRPGDPHTGFGQVQAYDQAAATSGESLHDFAEQHTPEALARDRGELPPEHQQEGPGFDRHALRDEAHLHGFHTVDAYVHAWENGEIFSAKGDPGYREVTKLTDAATGHQEAPSQYFEEHRHDHGGHDGGHAIPTQGGGALPPGVSDDNPFLHDWDWRLQPDVHGAGHGQVLQGHDPGLDPGGSAGVAYPGTDVGPVTIGADGTRTLPDGSHLAGEGADTLRIYPNGNTQDVHGNYLGEYHGEWSSVRIDPETHSTGGGPLGPDHDMDVDAGGHAPAPVVTVASGTVDGGQVVSAHGSVAFGSGGTADPAASTGSGGFASGGARPAADGTAPGQDPTHHGDAVHTDTGVDDSGHEMPEPEHHQPQESQGHDADSHASSHHDDGGDHHEASHGFGGMEHHVG